MFSVNLQFLLRIKFEIQDTVFACQRQNTIRIQSDSISGTEWQVTSRRINKQNIQQKGGKPSCHLFIRYISQLNLKIISKGGTPSIILRLAPDTTYIRTQIGRRETRFWMLFIDRGSCLGTRVDRVNRSVESCFCHRNVTSKIIKMFSKFDKGSNIGQLPKCTNWPHQNEAN